MAPLAAAGPVVFTSRSGRRGIRGRGQRKAPQERLDASDGGKKPRKQKQKTADLRGCEVCFLFFFGSNPT